MSFLGAAVKGLSYQIFKAKKSQLQFDFQAEINALSPWPHSIFCVHVMSRTQISISALKTS